MASPFQSENSALLVSVVETVGTSLFAMGAVTESVGESITMEQLLHMGARYTAEQQKLAIDLAMQLRKTIAEATEQLKRLQHNLAVQQNAEKESLSWHMHLTRRWCRAQHSNAGDNLNCTFVAHCLGIQRLINAGIVPSIDPELLEETLESVGYYKGQKGMSVVERGGRYKGGLGCDGQLEGYGEIYWVNEGLWFNGYSLGNMRCGILRMGNRLIHDGNWLDTKKSGHGICYFENKDRYDGNWLDGKQSGHGIYYYADGRRYDGNWLDDKKSGQGIYYFVNGERYDGNWLDGKQSGHGIKYDADGGRHDGNWLNGKKSGHGICYYADGRRYDGNWLDGKPSDHGIYYYADGRRYDDN